VKVPDSNSGCSTYHHLRTKELSNASNQRQAFYPQVPGGVLPIG
jgi:hypothetical protein